MSSHVIKFGKFVGKTLHEIYQEDADYVYELAKRKTLSGINGDFWAAKKAAQDFLKVVKKDEIRKRRYRTLYGERSED